MKRPAFQFYPKDWLSDGEAAAMSNEEKGVYITLLCYDWENDGLENNPDRLLQRLAHFEYIDKNGQFRQEEYDNCKDVVLSKFIDHPDKNGYITNNRLYNERKKQDNYHITQSKNGSKGGNPNFKKGKPNPYYAAKTSEKDNHNPKDNPKINSSSSSSSSSPSSNNIYNKFKEESNKRNIEIDISEKKYLELREEYVHNEYIVWSKEIKGLIEWLYDNKKKKVNANRIRNRMKKAIEFAKGKERKQLEDGGKPKDTSLEAGSTRIKEAIQGFSDKIGIQDFPALSKEEGETPPELLT